MPSAMAACRRAWTPLAWVSSRACSPARAALRLRAGFVHDEIAIAEEPAVQHLDGLAGLFLRRHLDEAKTSGPAGELVGDDADGLDRPGLRE